MAYHLGGRVDREHPFVDVGPSQRCEFGSARSGQCGEAQRQRSRRVELGCGGDRGALRYLDLDLDLGDLVLHDRPRPALCWSPADDGAHVSRF